jgi:beta-galactosidase GanA
MASRQRTIDNAGAVACDPGQPINTEKRRRTSRLRSFLHTAACLLAMLLPVFAIAGEMPRFVSANGRHALFVDGAPYSIMAAQLHNSSAWPQTLPKAMGDVEALHANTLEAPVYWEQFEPEPGRYDYRNIDALIAQARARGLRLALLWFGTWKNGQMHYVPDWIKCDRATYPRMLDANGVPVDVLSPHAPANVDADRRAFAALMRYLRKVDQGAHTVILVQVQNEPGAIGTVRRSVRPEDRPRRDPHQSGSRRG